MHAPDLSGCVGDADLDTEKARPRCSAPWVRMPDVHFGPMRALSRPASGFRRGHFAKLRRRHATRVIAPVNGDIYTEFLEAAGPGLHHVCVGGQRRVRRRLP
jgi:hypothetical protein